MFRLHKILLFTAAAFVSLCLLSGNAYAASSTGTVKCTGYLNVRQSASTRAKVVNKLYPNTQVSIVSSSNGWYKVAHGSIKGWVSARYISKTSSISSRGSAVTSSSNAGKCADVVEYALRYLGVRYAYGGSSPSGFDCSGFTTYVYSRAGIRLNRQASSQASQGASVSKSNLRPGDLVFFDTNGGHNSISHVGIYIGSGKFIHAASGSPHCITVDNLSESYYAYRYMTARRVIN